VTLKTKITKTKKMVKNHLQHTPVLIEPVLKYFQPQPGESYLDVTAGYGGHADEILARTLNYDKATLIDRDKTAITSLRQKFKGRSLEIIHGDFLSASLKLLSEGKTYDLILADLGVSSVHLDTDNRGFSFRAEYPLDMRMDQSQKTTAADIVNGYDEAELTRILHDYGEEPKARRIARLMIAARPIKTTDQLAAIVAKAWPGKSRMHPATRTFQALRIAVNSELEQLEKALPIWIELLAPGGRLAIISFHSLEDRIVKRGFAEAGGERFDSKLRLLTKRPVTAESNEIVSNPRARSAKLRAAVKIKNQKKGETNANSGKKPLPIVQS
jgi:16S rRNA (cytosine1402-N4)-methyltransferase